MKKNRRPPTDWPAGVETGRAWTRITTYDIVGKLIIFNKQSMVIAEVYAGHIKLKHVRSSSTDVEVDGVFDQTHTFAVL